MANYSSLVLRSPLLIESMMKIHDIYCSEKKAEQAWYSRHDFSNLFNYASWDGTATTRFLKRTFKKKSHSRSILDWYCSRTKMTYSVAIDSMIKREIPWEKLQ